MEKSLVTRIPITKGKQVFFASDNHLGAPTLAESRPREKQFVAWLDSVKDDAEVLFLLGDLFDFWFEYATVIPKGFTRVLGKLAELSDSGIKIYFFTGNHDLWMNGYFEEELNIKVFHSPQEFLIGEKHFFIGHGDGLGPHDKGYKRFKKIVTNSFFKSCFKWLHPDIGVKIAHYLSVKNKLISGKEDVKFEGEETEWLVQYCRRKLSEAHRDIFIFGHRHMPLNIKLDDKATYINLGDWITHNTYGQFNGNKFDLKKFE